MDTVQEGAGLVRNRDLIPWRLALAFRGPIRPHHVSCHTRYGSLDETCQLKPLHVAHLCVAGAAQ
jgi:hypothetical protein